MTLLKGIHSYLRYSFRYYAIAVVGHHHHLRRGHKRVVSALSIQFLDVFRLLSERIKRLLSFFHLIGIDATILDLVPISLEKRGLVRQAIKIFLGGARRIQERSFFNGRHWEGVRILDIDMD